MNHDYASSASADWRTAHVARLRSTMDIAVVAGALATVPLTVLQEQGITSTALDAIDWAVWAIFAIEFVVVLWLAPRTILRPTTLGRFAVVAVSFPQLPGLLALVRLARLGRLLRLMRLTSVTARGVTAMKEILGRRGLMYVTAVTTLLILVGGGCLSILEPQTVKGGYGDGIWWAIVTATTVGYGDISPNTLPGRVIAIVLMLVGIGLMSTLAASITSYFVQQTENTEFKELATRLERIEALLEQATRKPLLTESNSPETPAAVGIEATSNGVARERDRSRAAGLIWPK